MDLERKFKTLKIRVPGRTPRPSILFEKKKSLIKVAKKVNELELINKSLEKDFEFENTDRNPESFLKEPKDTHISISKQNSVSRQSIGSSKLFELLKERSEAVSASSLKREPRKKVTIKNALFHLLDKEIVINSQIENITERINESKKKTIESISRLSYMEKISYYKDQRSLRKFKSTQNTWDKIEGTLKKKLQRNDLVINRNSSLKQDDFTNDIEWCMLLRTKPFDRKIERYLPVGNRLSGLYSREFIKIDKQEEKIKRKSASCVELEILGSSKLPLEINAIKAPGNKLLTRKDLPETPNEEVFMENYDFSNNFYKKFY